MVDILIMGIIIGILVTWTLARNEVWKDDRALWGDCAKKSPHKIRTHQNLGVAYIEHRQFEKAIECYKTAIKIDPNDYVSWYNMAICYYEMRDLGRAYGPAHRAAILHTDTMTLYQLGITLRDMGWRIGMSEPKEVIE